MNELDFLEIPMSLSTLDPVNYQYFNQLLNHRTIIFNQEVASDIVEYITTPLKQFEKDGSNEPVTLILSTNGGSTMAGLSLCNIIENYKKPLRVIIENYAFSMGFYIAIAGKNNPNVTTYCYPFSFTLLHAGDTGANGEACSVRDILDFFNHVDNMIKDFVLSHTNITEEEYLLHERKQWYMTAEEMKTFGVVDKIIGVDCDGY